MAAALAVAGFAIGWALTRLTNRLKERGRLPGEPVDAVRFGCAAAMAGALMGVFHGLIGVKAKGVQLSLLFAVAVCLVAALAYLRAWSRGSPGARWSFQGVVCALIGLVFLALGQYGVWPSLRDSNVPLIVMGVCIAAFVVLLCIGEHVRGRSSGSQ
jgi:asparagine N-glycosylation enzyme membrane subunit Stt3